MNQTSKTIKIVALALVGAGIMISFLAFALGGFSFRSFGGTMQYTENTYTYEAAGLTDLNVSDINSAVILVGADTDKITVTCYENAHDKYDFTLGNGRLSIEKNANVKWYDSFFFNIDHQQKTLTIILPADLAASLDISSVSGDISISNAEIRELSVGSTSGAIGLKALNASGSVSASNVSGSIQIENTSLNGDLTVTDTSGKTELSFVTAAGEIRVKTVSGDVSAADTSAAGNVGMESTSGTIRFTNLGGNDFSFSSVSGDITGSLLGASSDYHIDAHSLSGEADVQGGSAKGTKELSASSTSGNIRITFTAD